MCPSFYRTPQHNRERELSKTWIARGSGCRRGYDAENFELAFEIWILHLASLVWDDRRESRNDRKGEKGINGGKGNKIDQIDFKRDGIDIF